MKIYKNLLFKHLKISISKYENKIINYKLKSGFVNRIMKSTVDPNLVIFLGSEGIHWITEVN